MELHCKNFLGFNFWKKFCLARHSSEVTLFLLSLYLERLPDSLPCLYKRFLFFMELINFFVSHGRFLRLGSVLLGMHSSIIVYSSLTMIHRQKDIHKLESVQKFALKLVSHQWDSSYDELLSLVDVPKLSERRLNLKLAQVFKIVHGLCYFPDNIFRMQPSYSNRLSRTDTIYCPFA